MALDFAAAMPAASALMRHVLMLARRRRFAYAAR